MKTYLKRGWLVLLWLGCAVVACGAGSGLRWDEMEKSRQAKRGEREAVFVFTATNKTDHPVEIVHTATSCHCTLAEAPRKPWIIAPGATEALRVVVDLTSRRGMLNKTIYVETNEGEDSLLVHVDVPPPPEIQREMNQDVARADRQAVLRGDCASCHVAPAVGKKGGELFLAACMVCHGAPNRASMVPDLMVPTVQRDAAYWEKVVREGKADSLMPAFSKEHGGFLDDEQVRSLVEFLVANLPKEPVKL